MGERERNEVKITNLAMVIFKSQIIIGKVCGSRIFLTHDLKLASGLYV